MWTLEGGPRSRGCGGATGARPSAPPAWGAATRAGDLRRAQVGAEAPARAASAAGLPTAAQTWRLRSEAGVRAASQLPDGQPRAVAARAGEPCGVRAAGRGPPHGCAGQGCHTGREEATRCPAQPRAARVRGRGRGRRWPLRGEPSARRRSPERGSVRSSARPLPSVPRGGRGRRPVTAPGRGRSGARGAVCHRDGEPAAGHGLRQAGGTADAARPAWLEGCVRAPRSAPRECAAPAGQRAGR